MDTLTASPTPTAAHRFRPAGRANARRSSLLAIAALLSGCGGGLYFELGENGDGPPQVELVADRSQAAPGGSVRLAAAASDDFDRIGAVRFYRLDAGGPVLLAVDTAAPFEATLTVPSDGRAEVSTYAEAVDGVGQVGQSGTVTVQIVP